MKDVFKAMIVGGVFLLSLPALAETAGGLKSGEQVYRETCIACHGPGLAGAPRVGDRRIWGKLASEGQAVLTAHGWVGVRAMPPRGGRNDLSLEEFARALAWMVRESGGNWQDPDAHLLERIRVEEGKRIEQLRKAGKG